jgi:single-strand DNA-binding protein
MLIGNVGKDPEVRHLEGGASVATLTLATNERYKDRSGETVDKTEWHNVVLWRNLADLAERYIRKGTQIYVEGKIRTRSWEDQSGQKKYTTEIVADNIQLLGRRSDNAATSSLPYSPGTAEPAITPSPASPAMDDDIEDLPF